MIKFSDSAAPTSSKKSKTAKAPAIPTGLRNNWEVGSGSFSTPMPDQYHRSISTSSAMSIDVLDKSMQETSVDEEEGDPEMYGGLSDNEQGEAAERDGMSSGIAVPKAQDRYCQLGKQAYSAKVVEKVREFAPLP